MSIEKIKEILRDYADAEYFYSEEGGYLRRHRLFESNFPIPQLDCNHKGVAVGVYGHGGDTKKHRMLYRQEASDAMKIDWMNRDCMCQAIPPAYTEYIGKYLMAEVLAKLEQTRCSK
ncbi:MAG: hypothetical protein WC479_07410 [Candidatus Izemoplasmatales bacterium]